MRIYAICLLVLAASFSAFAADETAAQLATLADSAPLDQQPALYLRAAQLQLKAADAHYDQGKADDGINDVKLITEYADKAADTAIRSGKKLKDAEIELRKISTRLSNIQHSLRFDDQAPVKACAEHLEELRTKLLARMFSKDKKK
ncbi:MAG TPA: hypothetical protein VLK33_13225 [Terriglobales bacterium]|nr:hypothetical protein [Terriglobales bacterium]